MTFNLCQLMSKQQQVVWLELWQCFLFLNHSYHSRWTLLSFLNSFSVPLLDKIQAPTVQYKVAPCCRQPLELMLLTITLLRFFFFLNLEVLNDVSIYFPFTQYSLWVWLVKISLSQICVFACKSAGFFLFSDDSNVSVGQLCLCWLMSNILLGQ